jgi:hypothetical protein
MAGLNPQTGLPQFDDSDVSRGSSFAGDNPFGTNPDPTLGNQPPLPCAPGWPLGIAEASIVAVRLGPVAGPAQGLQVSVVQA